MAETKTDWYFIVNPRAGSGKTMSEWVPAERRLDKLGIRYETALTDYKRHATTLAYEAARNGYRRIMAVGGDGSVHETLAGIASYCDDTGTPTEDFVLGVVPIGSGNDWIKGLRVPNDSMEVIDLMSAESFGKMDVVKVRSNGGKVTYMANIGGLGFDSHVCKRVNAQKESGMRNKMIYANALRYTIMTLKPIDVKVVADGVTMYEGSCYSIALGNGKYSGGGMRQVPLADMDDDMLDYTIIPRMPLPTLLTQVPRLFKGDLHESKYVISGRCKSMYIAALNEASQDIIEVDGELEGQLPLSIEMENRKIGVIKG